MTPRRKGARFLIHPMFARQLAYQLSRNKVAKLMQYTQLVRGWFCPFGFSSFLSFHRWFLNRNHRLTTRPTFFFCYLWDVIGFILAKKVIHKSAYGITTGLIAPGSIPRSLLRTFNFEIWKLKCLGACPEDLYSICFLVALVLLLRHSLAIY